MMWGKGSSGGVLRKRVGVMGGGSGLWVGGWSHRTPGH